MQMDKEERREAVEAYKSLINDSLERYIKAIERYMEQPTTKGHYEEFVAGERYDALITFSPREIIDGEYLSAYEVKKALAIKEGE